jgi:hypothetical protein
MARPLDWTARIPDALTQLRAMTSQTVYRGTLEQIFQIPRRTAIRLMHEFGGEQAGRTFLLDRQKLMAHLESLAPPTLPQPSHVRRQHREAAAFTFPVVPTPERRRAAALPPAVRLGSGQLLIQAATLEELCAHLWILLETCREDREGIEAQLREACV